MRRTNSKDLDKKTWASIKRYLLMLFILVITALPIMCVENKNEEDFRAPEPAPTLSLPKRSRIWNT